MQTTPTPTAHTAYHATPFGDACHVQPSLFGRGTLPRQLPTYKSGPEDEALATRH